MSDAQVAIATHGERADGLAAHGVDIGKGVGGRDLAVGVGVVHDGGEEIQGLHHCELVGEAVNRGVIRGGSSHQEGFILDLGQSAQDLREVGLAELGGSARTGGELGQTLDFFAGHARRVGEIFSGANSMGQIAANFGPLSLGHCQGLEMGRESPGHPPEFVIRAPIFLLAPLFPGVLSAVEHGPICEWHRDPTTTMAIHWVATAEKEDERGEWKLGAAGFGYGDDDDQTVLKGMRKNYRSVYIRRPYEVPANAPKGAELTIGIRYDDAFILYVDGKEVLRKGVEGAGADISKVKKHEAEVWEYFKLGPAVAGHKGVIAIEGHNEKIDSSDFTLRPRIDYRANGNRENINCC